MPSSFWPELQGLDWCVEAKPAAHGMTDEHVFDLAVVYEAFAEWLGAARIDYSKDFHLNLAAASPDEAARFQREIAQLVAQHDLFLITSVYRRASAKAAWEDVTPPDEPTPDDEIERELENYVGPYPEAAD